MVIPRFRRSLEGMRRLFDRINRAVFSAVARGMGCASFRERDIARCMVLECTPPRDVA